MSKYILANAGLNLFSYFTVKICLARICKTSRTNGLYLSRLQEYIFLCVYQLTLSCVDMTSMVSLLHVSDEESHRCQKLVVFFKKKKNCARKQNGAASSSFTDQAKHVQQDEVQCALRL